MIPFLIFLAAVCAYFAIFCMISRKPSLTIPSRDLLICAAHSDDCVIMGAEMAYGSLKEGYSVRILFLTCSAEIAESDMAGKRAAEAIKAWGSVNVPRENIRFINLPQSRIGGAPQYSDDDLERASGDIEDALNAMPEGSYVILPAEGETHVDHISVRQAAIGAARRLKRGDLTFFETPEYNLYLSMAQDPLRVVEKIARSIPYMEKLMGRESVFSGFPRGAPGSVFRDSPNRLDFKISMFDHFISQNPELLRAYFSSKSRYRALDVFSEPNPLSEKRYFKILSRNSDFSVVMFLLLVFGLAGTASHAVFDRFGGGGFEIGHLISLILMAAILAFGVARRRLTFSFLVGAMLVGLLAGLQ